MNFRSVEYLSNSLEIKEALEQLLERKISSRVKSIKVGYKWWNREMQDDCETLLSDFQLLDDKWDQAIKILDPFESSAEEDKKDALLTTKRYLIRLSFGLRRYLDDINIDPNSYKITSVRKNYASSRGVGFEYYSFVIHIL